MPDFRAYCDTPPDEANGLICLNTSESKHLIAANRARLGDPVRAFDGQGTEWDTQVRKADKQSAELRVLATHCLPKPPFQVALAQALPKGKRLESIIKKATEIGIQQVYPVLSKRCEAKLDPTKTSAKSDKWTTASLEAAKQCGNPYLVDIHPPIKFASLIEEARLFDLKLIASLQANTRCLQDHLAQFAHTHKGLIPQRAICLIGPEGDFSPEEYQQASQAGFLPITLGPHVMRSETAAAYALSILRHELEYRLSKSQPKASSANTLAQGT